MTFETPNNEDLRPRKAVVLVGVGGTGAKGIVSIQRELEAGGSSIGDAVNGDGAYVTALLVDGDRTTWTPSEDNPDAEILDRLRGNDRLKVLHLFDPAQNDTIRKFGLDRILTPGLPSDADAAGCNANPKASAVRYFRQRQLVGDVDQNPREVLRDIALDLKNVGADFVLGETIELIFIAGTHGGTGPVVLPLAAEATEIFKSLLGRGADRRVVTSTGYLMSDESARLDRGMAGNARQVVKRQLNSAVTLMLADEATVTGGVTLADGETRIEEVPFGAAFVVDAQSSNNAVRDHYAPITVVARAIAAHIMGRGTAVPESNVELGVEAPRDEFDTVAANHGAIGLAELQTNPSKNLSQWQLSRAAIDKATNVDNNDDAETARLLGRIGLNSIIDSVMDAVEEEMPSIEAMSFGSVAQAGINSQRVSGDFGGEMPEFKIAIRKAAQVTANDLVGRIHAVQNELYDQHQVGVLVDTMEALVPATDRLIENLTGEVAARRAAIRVQNDILQRALTHLQSLPYTPFAIWKKGKQEKAINAAIDAVVSAADTYVQAVANFEVRNALLGVLQSGDNAEGTNKVGLRSAVNHYLSGARETKADILSVRDGLKPKGTVRTAFDLVRTVPAPDLTDVDVSDLKLEDYSREEIEAIAESVSLDPTQHDLTALLKDSRVQAELRRRSSVLMRPVRDTSFRGKDVISQITVPVRDGDGYDVDRGGTIKNATDLLGIEGDVTATAVNERGPVVSISKLFGLKLSDGVVASDNIRKVIETARTNSDVVERGFHTMGQMERVLPVFARHFAEIDKELAGNRGEIEEVPVPGRDGMTLAKWFSPAELKRRDS